MDYFPLTFEIQAPQQSYCQCLLVRNKNWSSKLIHRFRSAITKNISQISGKEASDLIGNNHCGYSIIIQYFLNFYFFWSCLAHSEQYKVKHQSMQASSQSKIGHRQHKKDRLSAPIKLFSFRHQSKKTQLDDSLRNQPQKPTEMDNILEQEKQNQQQSHFFQDFQEGWLKNCDDWETETEIREF